jgi:ketosteroid isomerase-like protein
MTTETIKTHDEAQIQQLIADKANAICAKDLDRIMATTPQMSLSKMRSRRSKSEVQMPSAALGRRACHTS